MKMQLKRIISLLLMLLLIFSFVGCGSSDVKGNQSSQSAEKDKPLGTYSDVNSENTYLCFYEDGKVVYTYVNDMDSFVSDGKTVQLPEYYIEEGTFTMGDEQTIYIFADSEAFHLTYLGNSQVKYDVTADMVISDSLGMEKFINVSDDPSIGIEKVEAEVQNKQSVSEQNTSTSDNQSDVDNNVSDQNTSTSNDTNEYLKAINTYMGNPVEAGTADWDSFSLIAIDNENIYWWWQFGGGFGILQQNANSPSKISEDQSTALGSKMKIITLLDRLLNPNKDNVIAYSSVNYIENITFEYEGQVLDGEKWNVIDSDGLSFDVVLAYYIPKESLEYIADDESADSYSELTMFVGDQPIAAFDNMEGYPYAYN